jgi:hypothetical protein
MMVIIRIVLTELNNISDRSWLGIGFRVLFQDQDPMNKFSVFRDEIVLRQFSQFSVTSPGHACSEKIGPGVARASRLAVPGRVLALQHRNMGVK